MTTQDGRPVNFDELWARRQTLLLDGAPVCIPSVNDLILTKQVAPRAKDLEDIRLLRILEEERR